MASLIGQRLGNYEIFSLPGEGGMAAEYRARKLVVLVGTRKAIAIAVRSNLVAGCPVLSQKSRAALRSTFVPPADDEFRSIRLFLLAH
jgi:hypothetical protein